MPFSTTVAPASARARARALPIPRLEPVTRAVRPVRSKSDVMLCCPSGRISCGPSAEIGNCLAHNGQVPIAEPLPLEFGVELDAGRRHGDGRTGRLGCFEDEAQVLVHELGGPGG